MDINALIHLSGEDLGGRMGCFHPFLVRSVVCIVFIDYDKSYEKTSANISKIDVHLGVLIAHLS